MTKAPSLPTITGSFASSTQLNAAFRAIEDSFENTLSLDGSTPNSMNADIDLNSNDLLNVKTLEAEALFINGIPVSATSIEASEAIQYSTNYEFLATNGQTVFTGVDVAGRTLDLISVHWVQVAGVTLAPSNYTKSSDGLTLTIVGDVTVFAGDKVVIGGMGYAPSAEGTQFPELNAPYTVRPSTHRWDLLSFTGARAEIAKSTATQDWVGVLSTALNSGEKVNIGSGIWPIRSTLFADKGLSVVDVPVDVEAASDARFTFYGIDYEGGFFDFRSANPASWTNRWKARWHGGVFDCTNLSSDLEYGISVFDIFDGTDVDLSDMAFLGWNETLSERTVDTGITLHNCPNFNVRKVFGAGMKDSVLYISGNNSSGAYDLYSDGGVVDNIAAWRCGNMLTLKRWHRGALIKNFRAVECDNGILSSPVDGSTTNHGHSCQISNGYMLRMSGRPIQITGGVDTKITNVTIEDFGHVLATPSTPTDVAGDNNIAGIDLRATVNSVVKNCSIRQNAWAGSTQAITNKLVTGIRLGRYSTTGSVYSSGCLVKDNIISKVHRGILEDAGCSNNIIENNLVSSHTSGTVAQSAVLGTNTVHKPAEKQYSLTNDPTSVAAGGELVISIPATEVKKGDIVFAWMSNRQAGDAGVNALDLKALCSDGAVDIVLTNNSASSVDLGNTVFKALARPTI